MYVLDSPNPCQEESHNSHTTKASNFITVCKKAQLFLTQISINTSLSFLVCEVRWHTLRKGVWWKAHRTERGLRHHVVEASSRTNGGNKRESWAPASNGSLGVVSFRATIELQSEKFELNHEIHSSYLSQSINIFIYREKSLTAQWRIIKTQNYFVNHLCLI